MFLAAIVLVSVAEMLFLYWNAARATARASEVAGLSVAGEDVGHVVSTGLARAALELPDPPEPVYGIDPFARTPRWKLALFAVLYRLKVGATSFLLRVFLRRLFGRAALRFFIPLLSIPVYAVWNAVVTYWALRQVRVRSFGPAAVRDAVGKAVGDAERLSLDARRALVSGLGEIVIRYASAHPNFFLLFERLLPALGVSASEVESHWDRGRELLADLSAEERRSVLTAFEVAAVIDGRLRRGELELLADAHRRSGVSFDPDEVRRMRDDFLAGGGIRSGTERRPGLRMRQRGRLTTSTSVPLRLRSSRVRSVCGSR